MQQEIQSVEEAPTDEEEAFVRFDIATYPSDLTLQVLLEQWRVGDIEIPDFQRAYVWKQKQASLLIESFLLGLPVPPVFFYVGEDNKSIVIDGQQRITSVVYFLDGFFGKEDEKGQRTVFRLTGLSNQSPFFNKSFKELSESDQRKLRNAVLRAINIRQLSPDKDASSMYYIFERLNTGGTPLKPQEIRNCVYRGNVVKKLEDLNLNSDWRALVGSPEPDKHQRDIELILRLLALCENFAGYEKPMKEFLNSCMKRNAAFEAPAALEFERNFPLAVKRVAEKLGNQPFRYGGPTNSAFLEAVMLAVMENRDSELPADFVKRFNRMKQSEEFRRDVSASTSDNAVVARRKKTAAAYLFGDAT